MKRITQIIFPYNLYLHIFQLERYDISRAIPWIKNNFFVRSNKNKKPLVITGKIKTINKLSLLWFIILILIAFKLSVLAGIVVLVLLIIQPYFLIILAIISLKPYERWNWNRTIQETRKKIQSLQHTKVVGIAGSYGKTSVKDILFHLLKSDYKVLKTPLSYNTIFGMAQVIDLELDDSYDYFLCELGEFQKGDIAEMCEIVLPHYGIITGINNQHLERFKKIENTTATIFELADYLKIHNQKTVVNGLNDYIKQEIQKRELSEFIAYSGTESDITITNVTFSDQGARFILSYKNQTYDLKTPLLGYAHLNNILGAITLALQIGAPVENLTRRIAAIPHVPHRFDQKVFETGILLIDNSYSSNSDSFKESLQILKELDRKSKILVTPGMVELGAESNAIHEELGELANNTCTYVILVGKSGRTESLAKSIDQQKIIWMDDIGDLWQTVNELHLKNEEVVILLENDLPDNY